MIIKGKHVVEEALRSTQTITKVSICQGFERDAQLRHIMALAQKKSIPCDVISKENFWSKNPNAQNIVKNASNIEKVINLLNNLDIEINDLEEFIKLIKDDPSELEEIKNQFDEVEQKIIDLEEESLYSSEFDDHSAVLTVNAGAGGVDAHDWAEMLLRMYTRYLDNKKMSYEIEEISSGEEAGIKSASIRVENFRAYANLESERGVHRLVRISPFDSNKRRHTSFAGVDVIPLIEDSEDLDLNDDDIRIDVYRSGGAGGQSVNTTDSAVRITHLPSGIVVTQQDERSQHKNKAKALKILRSRIYEEERLKKQEELSSNRKSQVGSGDRSERIRTYNFPQGRVSDHRINLTLYKLDQFLTGEALEEMISALSASEQAEKLNQLNVQ